MSCDDLDKKNTTANAMNHVENKAMEEATQNLPPHASRPDPTQPPGKNPGASLMHKAVDKQLEKPSEATGPDKNSSSGNGQLARRANQLSDFLEQADLMEIALNPSREEERLKLESYLGYVRRLLEGMAADDGQAVNEPPLPAPDGKSDHKTSPKPKEEV